MQRSTRAEGPGVLHFHNRDLYIGDFTNGTMHGEGVLFCRKQARLTVLRGRAILLTAIMLSLLEERARGMNPSVPEPLFNVDD
jgi:hypothetical protein